MEREAPMSILSDNYIDFKHKRVLQIENLSPARPFFYNSYLQLFSTFTVTRKNPLKIAYGNGIFAC